MNYFALWKHWIRPFAIVLYFILLTIAFPLCIVELTRKDPPDHVKAWFTGGLFVMIAVPVSLWGILQHLIHYTEPHLQKYIIRILWMVPIYGLNAWFALRFNSAAIYLDTIRECYEAYVIYNFMAYLLSFLWNEHPYLARDLEAKPQVKQFLPFCCLPPWPMGNKMINYCKHGVLQYTIVRPVTTLIAVLSQIFDKYDEGDFNFTTSWSYLVIINNISQIWAMYCLVLFYKATKEEIKPLKPVPKFLCVKFVVFFSFWQAVVIAIFAKLGWIPQNGEWDFYKSVEDVATGIQDFCICIEMFLAAVAHRYAFSHHQFIRPDDDQANCCYSFRAMWDISDVTEDVVEHVRVIGKTMKKTVSGPFRGGAVTDTETTPLLASSPAPVQSSSQTQQVVAEEWPRSQADNESCVSDWDVTSVEKYSSNAALTKSTTASMNNYLECSSGDGLLQDKDLMTATSQPEPEEEASHSSTVAEPEGPTSQPYNTSTDIQGAESPSSKTSDSDIHNLHNPIV